MNLITFGCSNTYGHGLEDCYMPDGTPGGQPSKLSWPNYTAKLLGYELFNEAQPGASNKRIWHNALHYRYNIETITDTVIIMWSYLPRYSILKKSHEKYKHERMKRCNNLHINDQNKASHFYFKRLFEIYDAEQELLAHASHLHYQLTEQKVKNFHIFSDHKMYDADFYGKLPKKMLWKHWGFHWTENRLDVSLDNDHSGPKSHEAWGKKVFEWVDRN